MTATEPRHLPVDGLTVTRIAVDDSLALTCHSRDGRRAEVRIDGPFVLRDVNGDTHPGCVEDRPSTAGPVLDLVLATIRAAWIDGAGNLAVDFTDGASLEAAAEEHFVSWEVRTSTGFHAVCLADRDVVVKDIA